jgi:hypothetical protein
LSLPQKAGSWHNQGVQSTILSTIRLLSGLSHNPKSLLTPIRLYVKMTPDFSHKELPTSEIRLSPEIKAVYSEVIPVLSGRGKNCSITLLGRRRDDPAKLDKILTQPWRSNEPITIKWSREEGLETASD